MSERFEYFDENDKIDKEERNAQQVGRLAEINDIELEQSAGQKESDASHGGWIKHPKIENIPLDKIDLSHSYVNGPEDFQHGSYSEMLRGVRILANEVQPAVEKGADIEHFRELDHQRGVDYMHGTQRVYETFWGAEPIKLNKIGDRYLVDGGYHRLYIAKELGLGPIPAQVWERRL